MIGDILHDVEAGHRAGCRSVLIDNGNETEWQTNELRQPDLIAPDLYSAAQLIAAQERKQAASEGGGLGESGSAGGSVSGSIGGIRR
jgi:beta-phosphoglucomutase-like phosphatase (HAD superfamily)